ncbi:hypothetical protein C8J57DRAFT_431723 [Mycena rebaudengoi]|nr:hypothetical protein C8J57DRAFT_431723 [Mycena rebaudengoi]
MKSSIAVLATLLMAVGHISATPVIANSTQADAQRVVARCADRSAQTSLFRLYNKASGDHFYTTNVAERATALRGGYSDENIAATVFRVQSGPTVPFYRLYNKTSGDHFYTASASEARSARGYTAEGIAVYVYATSTCNSVPLYRLYNGKDHFYTKDVAEKDAAARGGYKVEGAAAFVL